LFILTLVIVQKKKMYDSVGTPTFNSIQRYESSYNFHFFLSYKLANGIVKYMFTTVGKFWGFRKWRSI